MDNGEVKRIIQEAYGISGPISCRETVHGSGNTWLISAREGQWVAKDGERPDFLQLYKKILSHKAMEGFELSRIRPTMTGTEAAHGLVLYQLLQGETRQRLDREQEESALGLLGRFHRALAHVPYEGELQKRNCWDKAGELSFLSGGFCGQYGRLLPEELRQLVETGCGLLRERRPQLEMVPRQIIHADPGPDNFLFRGKTAAALLDFTPAVEPPVVALGHFFYWNVLWSGQEEEDETLVRYAGLFGCCDKEALKTAVLYCALFRFAGPFLEMLERGGLLPERLARRAELIGRAIALADEAKEQ